MMELSEVRIDSVTTVAVKGRVDSTTATALRDRLTALVQAGNADLVVDFGEVDYMSSAGFRTLLIASKAAEESGGRLVLCGINGELRRLFEIGAFIGLFPILPSREEAAASIKRPA